MSETDPTDETLAAIASILDKAKPPPEAGQTRPEESPSTGEHIEADGYFKIGPGPIGAIRFRWTIRRSEAGEYHVDETIGDGTATVTSGPMSREAAIKFVDDREAEARRGFENLRNQMSGRATLAEPVGNHGGET